MKNITVASTPVKVTLRFGQKGERGIGVSSVSLDDNAHLIVTFDDGKTQDAGAVLGDVTSIKNDINSTYEKIQASEKNVTTLEASTKTNADKAQQALQDTKAASASGITTINDLVTTKVTYLNTTFTSLLTQAKANIDQWERDAEDAIHKAGEYELGRLNTNYQDAMVDIDNSVNKAEAWAVSEHTPDREPDMDSPTGLTQSSRTWALYSKQKVQEATDTLKNIELHEQNVSDMKDSVTRLLQQTQTSEANAKSYMDSAKASQDVVAASATAAADSATSAAADAKEATTIRADIKNQLDKLKNPVIQIVGKDTGGLHLYFLDETTKDITLAEMGADTSTEVSNKVSDALTTAKAYADKKVSDLVGGAPEALDTLKELADALGNDANMAATVTKKISDLSTALTQETTDRKAGDTDISNTLQTQTSTLKQADTDLGNKITAEAKSRTDGDAATLTSATEYTDTQITAANKTITNYVDNSQSIFFVDSDVLSDNTIPLSSVDTNNRAVKVGDTIIDNKHDRYFVTKVTPASGTEGQDGYVAASITVGSARGTNNIANKTDTQAALDKKVSLSGDTMTGTLVAPVVQTGTADTNYLQTKRLRGEGNATQLYHAIDFGYSDHNQVDFYEYGAVWNFHQVDSDNNATLVGAIKADGWHGNVIGNADTATKLSCNDTGGENTPVYWKDGLPVACSLSNYATTDNMTTELAKKVDKEGYIAYSQDEKDKLAGIETGANNYTLPIATSSALGGVKGGSNVAISAAGVMSVDLSAYQTTADADEKYYTKDSATTDLAKKVDKVTGKGLSTEDYTTAEKTKLAGIAEGANNYTLPVASDTVLGGVKVGSGITIDKNGAISATSVTVDSTLSADSTNPVQNKVIKSALDSMQTAINALTTQYVSPVYYSRNAQWKAAKTTITVPSYVGVAIGNQVYTSSGAQALDITQADSWDTDGVVTSRAGQDFYIYACQPTTGTVPKFIVSANSTVPTGYTADNSRKIGGFHCECADIGTISGHPLSGYVAGDILPASVWDLKHRPISSPEGMVFDGRRWIDIYIASWDGSKLVSKYGGVIADGESTPKWHGEKFEEEFANVGKHLLSRSDFMHCMKGTPEGTNIASGKDANTTGGHSDTNSRRIVSNYGVEDCTGVVWQWGSDLFEGGAYGTTQSADKSEGYNKYLNGYSWINNTDSSVYSASVDGDTPYGSCYGFLRRVLFGGRWDDGSACGSRWAYCGVFSAGRYGGLAGRGASEPLAVEL